MKPGFIRVKIAVCINEDGEYSSCGYDHGTNKKADYDEMINLAQEGLDFPPFNKTFWLEATIAIPEGCSIEGKVSDIGYED